MSDLRVNTGTPRTSTTGAAAPSAAKLETVTANDFPIPVGLGARRAAISDAVSAEGRPLEKGECVGPLGLRQNGEGHTALVSVNQFVDIPGPGDTHYLVDIRPDNVTSNVREVNVVLPPRPAPTQADVASAALQRAIQVQSAIFTASAGLESLNAFVPVWQSLTGTPAFSGVEALVKESSKLVAALVGKAASLKEGVAAIQLPVVSAKTFPFSHGLDITGQRYGAVSDAVKAARTFEEGEAIGIRGARTQDGGFVALVAVNQFTEMWSNTHPHFLVTVNADGKATETKAVKVVD